MSTTGPSKQKTKPPKSDQQTSVLRLAEQGDPRVFQHLRTPEAARFLGVSISFLNHARIRGDGPQYRKLSPKLVVYSIEDLRTWVNSKSRCSTSSSGPSQP